MTETASAIIGFAVMLGAMCGVFWLASRWLDSASCDEPDEPDETEKKEKTK